MLPSSELMSLLEDFYTLTNIRIVLFDEHYRELCSFPSGENTFCFFLRQNKDFDACCRKCDADFFARSKRKAAVQIYRCHAGLTEASVPILQGSRIIGYLMFGQITDEKDSARLKARLEALCRQYGISEIPEEKIAGVKYKDKRQILAAAKVLEACAGYVILKNLIRRNETDADRVEQYIEDHLREDLSPASLCKVFCLSRTGLYQLMKPYCAGGISGHIKEKRLAKAKQMIENTNASLQEIADTVGFGDYNYFLRCFKAKYGHPSGYFRK